VENILQSLNETQTVVDLGCGLGSFHYEAYRCRILAIDLSFRSENLNRQNSRLQYLQADSAEIPIASNAVDAVVCNHTLEHFAQYRNTLREIGRILNFKGMLWISVPNGYGFDDSLYRLVFDGGGHVNRFTQAGLVKDVEAETDLKLLQAIDLYSGFVYLRRPSPDDGPVPRSFNTLALLGINAVTRLVDKFAGSRISQYGWGFVFARPGVELSALTSYFNVCWKCGSGNDAEILKHQGRIKKVMVFSMYSCLDCGEQSIFIEPPPGIH
jgi:SAM-dependent methyltransferase